jgi:hypothetical protein
VVTENSSVRAADTQNFMFSPKGISSFYGRQVLARHAFQGAELSMHTSVAVKQRRREQERGKYRMEGRVVAKGGIEPPTQGFSVLCSTD